MPNIASRQILQASSVGLSSLLTGALIALALPIGTAEARSINRGLEPTHQPIVSRTDFVFDVNASSGSLTSYERARLIDWFDAVRLGYGDRVAIAAVGYDRHALSDSIADVVARYGLLLSDNAPTTVGEPQAGAVRIVVSRSIATVEGCPSWRDKNEADFTAGLSDNYGCAMASNLAAMVADPQDLVDGRSTQDLRTWFSSRAIQTYRDKAPTGSGDLKSLGN